MATRSSLSISLTPQLQKYVARKVRTGQYLSASEVIREALRALQRLEADESAARADVAEKLRIGRQEARSGRTLDAADAFTRVRATVNKDDAG